jgi:hypothetical protein
MEENNAPGPLPKSKKRIVWAEVDINSMRLSGKVAVIPVADPGPSGWVKLEQSVAVMILNKTKSAEHFALVGDKIVEVPLDIDLRFLSYISHTAWPDITTIDHKWTKVPWIPLDIPKIEPDDWDLFWKLWNEKAGEVSRVYPQTEPVWKGLGIYTRPDIDVSKFNYPKQVFENWEPYFPKMFAAIKNSLPYASIEKVVLWSNVNEVQPHFDPDYQIFPFPDSLRIMLWDTNEGPTFYMSPWPERTSAYSPQPVTVRNGPSAHGFKSHRATDDMRMYVDLPKDTNSFLFNNGAFVHGADLAKPKIIMAVKGIPSIYKWLATLESSYIKYKDYIPTFERKR